MKKHTLSLSLVLSVLLFNSCFTQKHDFDNPLDPGGVNFKSWPAPTLSAPGVALAGTQYSVTWSDVGVSSYLIEEADNQSFTNATNHTVGGISYSFSHEEADKTYYYRVKTNTGEKDSGWSKTLSVAIIEGPTSNIQLVTIPSGTFRMGDVENYGQYSDEKPVHSVTLSSFAMSNFEITQGQYQSVIGTNPSSSYGVSDTYPVYNVSWYDAVKFCNKLSDAEGLERCYNESTWACDFGKNGYRLPTEAEWEYACRAGTETNFYTGNTISSKGSTSTDLDRAGWYWYNWGETNNTTHFVGAKEPNAFGLFDMHGNVWEWCNDCYGSYSRGSASNPTGAQTGSYRVFRGGCWSGGARYCRSAYRYNTTPYVSDGSVGFRVVRRP